MNRGELGKLGEEIASRFLSKRGYLVIARNYRKPWGEIDIVAKHPNGMLVFVEVKTMHEGDIKPEDQMTGAKIRKLRRTCELFANDCSDLVHEKRGWQIDLVAVGIPSVGGKEPVVRHYESAG